MKSMREITLCGFLTDGGNRTLASFKDINHLSFSCDVVVSFLCISIKFLKTNKSF